MHSTGASPRCRFGVYEMGNLDAFAVAAMRRRRNRWAISALTLNWILLLTLLGGVPGVGS